MFTIPKTTTIREIQRNYKKVFEEVKKTKEPIVIMKNNKPDIALVDVQKLEELNRQLEEFEMQEVIRSAQLGAKDMGKLANPKPLTRFDEEYWRNLWKMIKKSRSIKGRNIDTSKFIAEDRHRH